MLQVREGIPGERGERVCRHLGVVAARGARAGRVDGLEGLRKLLRLHRVVNEASHGVSGGLPLRRGTVECVCVCVLPRIFIP